MTTKILSLLTSTLVLTITTTALAKPPGRGRGYRPPQPPPQHGRYDSSCVVHGTKSNGHGYPSTSTEYEAVGRNDREACNIALNYCYQDRARNCEVTSINGYAPRYPGYPIDDGYGPSNPYDPYRPQPGYPGQGGGGGYSPYPGDGAPGVGGDIGDVHECVQLPDGRQIGDCN